MGKGWATPSYGSQSIRQRTYVLCFTRKQRELRQNQNVVIAFKGPFLFIYHLHADPAKGLSLRQHNEIGARGSNYEPVGGCFKSNDSIQ